MNKLWLIIKREYMTRITKRAFILGTFLTPLGIGLLIFVNVKLSMYKDDNVKTIAILDQSGMIHKRPSDESNLKFTLTTESLDTLKQQVLRGQYSGVLVVPPLKDFISKRHTINYFSDDKLSVDMSDDVQSKISDAIKSYKIDSLRLDTAKLQALNTKIRVEPRPIKGKDDASSLTSLVAMALGVIMGFIMYISVFIYGMMVYRSVTEEKTSRIVEVMISSVRPFQLMMGKIIGVGAVGLTQLIVWVILIGGISVAVPLVMKSSDVDKMAQTQQAKMQGMQGTANMPAMDLEGKNDAAQVLLEFQRMDWWTILPVFILFFLLGYVLYSALFAAVGSAVGDDVGEGQALTLPITIPVILAIYIMLAAVRAPDSSLAVWSSMFPLFSPIVMPARLPFHPPAWQIIVSLLLLILTVIALVWLAGRIYRVGILMYGKKVTFKELGKWLFYKD